MGHFKGDNMKALFTILGSLLFFAGPAHAGLMLEPYLTYETSNLRTEPLPGVNLDSKNSGTTAIGGRIGYELLVPIWFAADVSMSSGTFKPDLPLYADSTFKKTNIYATVGFDFPILFRAWLGVGISNKMTTSSGGIDRDFSGGSHQKMGLGLTFLPMVSLNLEAFTSKPDLPTGVRKSEETGLQLGVSLPLDL